MSILNYRNIDLIDKKDTVKKDILSYETYENIVKQYPGHYDNDVASKIDKVANSNLSRYELIKKAALKIQN